MRQSALRQIGILVVALFGATAALAIDDQTAFLGQLHKQGYGEAAVDFLESLRSSGTVSAALAETIDLELSESLLLAAKNAINARVRDDLLARAEAARQKFVDEHPNHARAGDALAKKGDLTFETGLRKLFDAKMAKEPTAKASALVEARKAFEDAREPFTLAVTAAKNKLAELQGAYDDKYQKKSNRGKKPAKTPPRSRDQSRAEDAVNDALFDWLEARFKVIQIDYYVAQTFTGDGEKNDRSVRLQNAAKAFNQIYQEYRYADDNRVSLMAHAWEGRCRDDLGDLRTAQDIYDEVLSIMPEGDRDKAIRQMGGFEALFSQVSYFNFQVMRRADGQEKFVAEASQWLKDFKTWNKQPGYQGIVLEVTKSQLGIAEKADESRKKPLIAEVVKRLQENSKIPSEHNGEINLLLRQYRKASPANATGDPTTLEEAIALAEESVAAADWSTAVELWRRAASLAEKRTTKKDARLVDKVKDGLPYARFRLALAKSVESAETPADGQERLLNAYGEFESLATEHIDRAIGPVAASQAVKTALTLYAAAKSRPDKAASVEALDRLTKACDFLTSKWPDKAEADDARIALGQAAIVRGELDAALGVFDRVNPQSDRYPTALFLAGQTHWQLYQLERKKPTGPDPQIEAQHLKLASERLSACRDSYQKLRAAALQKNREAPEDPALELQQREATVRLAEVLIELNEGPSAAALVQPLIDAIRSAKPAQKWQDVDNLTMRFFLAAVRANVISADLAQANQASQLLTELTADVEGINKQLNSFVKMLFDAVKRAQEDIANAQENSDAAGESLAKQRLENNQKVLGQLLDRLADREQNSLESRMYIAMVAGQIGNDRVARNLYEQVLKKAEADPEFLKKFDGQITRIRAELVGLQRREGAYDKAIEAIDGLLATKPGALPLMMERGRILEAWAEKEPQRLSDAVVHWTDVRGKLGSLAKRPPEYFEANYSAASCLYKQSLATGDAEKRTTALKLLNGLILTNPTLNGQHEMAAKYRALISKMQGGKKPAQNAAAAQ